MIHKLYPSKADIINQADVGTWVAYGNARPGRNRRVYIARVFQVLEQDGKRIAGPVVYEMGDFFERRAQVDADVQAWPKR